MGKKKILCECGCDKFHRTNSFLQERRNGFDYTYPVYECAVCGKQYIPKDEYKIVSSNAVEIYAEKKVISKKESKTKWVTLQKNKN